MTRRDTSNQGKVLNTVVLKSDSSLSVYNSILTAHPCRRVSCWKPRKRRAALPTAAECRQPESLPIWLSQVHFGFVQKMNIELCTYDHMYICIRRMNTLKPEKGGTKASIQYFSPTDFSPICISPTDFSPTDFSPTYVSTTYFSPTDYHRLFTHNFSPTDFSNDARESANATTKRKKVALRRNILLWSCFSVILNAMPKIAKEENCDIEGIHFRTTRLRQVEVYCGGLYFLP